MEASIQLIPKNTPQDCLRAQVFLFNGERWEEGGTESKRPSLHTGDLGALRVWGRLRIIKSEGNLRSPMSSTREGSSLVLVRQSRSSESMPGKPSSQRVTKLLSFTCGVLGILGSWRDKVEFREEREERLGPFLHLWLRSCTSSPLSLAPYFPHVPGYRGIWDTQLPDANWEGKIFLGPR